MSDEQLPEPDRIDGAPHPRDSVRIVGQDAAQAAFLEAFNSGHLHHAWLITGPKGTGKATLAWAIARFLLATPPDDGGGLFGAPPPVESLNIDPEHPVARRMRSGAEQGLFVLRRPWDDKAKRLRQEITVEEARKMKGFFALSSADGGRRVVIVDSADELNVNAANAILKILEEPPARTTILMVAHQPSALLPTIRSRCRELRLAPLGRADLETVLAQSGVEVEGPVEALSALSGGSAGEAVRLSLLGGPKLYAELIQTFSALPRLDRAAAIRLADSATGRGAEDRRDLIHGLTDLFLSRLALTGALGQPPGTEAAPGEFDLLMRLAPDARSARRWAETAAEIGGRTRHGRAVNLDPAALILDTLFRLQKTAAA
ncbi:DNA polymerase III subunit delta' [Oceanicola sp. 22II-s10i]|uniref:DNA polymerase III subunit delta' n=1 Tax=Oceanicola sp. 22II-s10i TaxID=1317116 RepID=UPI000B52584E|nr:DNA polymerase III subunit delta' [Oceanicola sp. 22II-s10i]OWU85724.1 DNA polymerase III subunit delta' [Oceanicola sp. 22II-s10i]